jgi:hypothetical protein
VRWPRPIVRIVNVLVAVCKHCRLREIYLRQPFWTPTDTAISRDASWSSLTPDKPFHSWRLFPFRLVSYSQSSTTNTCSFLTLLTTYLGKPASVWSLDTVGWFRPRNFLHEKSEAVIASSSAKQYTQSSDTVILHFKHTALNCLVHQSHCFFEHGHDIL